MMIRTCLLIAPTRLVWPCWNRRLANIYARVNRRGCCSQILRPRLASPKAKDPPYRGQRHRHRIIWSSTAAAASPRPVHIRQHHRDHAAVYFGSWTSGV